MSEPTVELAAQADLQLAFVVTSNAPCRTEEICSAIRRERPTLPIIVLGPDVAPIKLKLFALGVDDYVLDSFDRLELLARIKSLIRRHWLSLA